MIQSYGEAEYPVTEVLRMSENSGLYDWNEAAIFQHDLTGYYAFYDSSGCSCNYFEDEYSIGFFRDELVWHSNRTAPVLDMVNWIQHLPDAGERVAKLSRLSQFLDGRV